MTTIAGFRRNFPGMVVEKICVQLKEKLGEDFDYSIDPATKVITLTNVPTQNQEEVKALMQTVEFTVIFTN